MFSGYKALLANCLSSHHLASRGFVLKNLFGVLAALTLLIVGQGVAQADPVIIGGPVVNPNNGHTYYLLSSDTWTASQSFALTLGGNLVTINDAAENAWVFSTFSTFGSVNRDLWIGLNDAASEGTFVWASGEPLIYTNWSPGNPDNFGGIEDYVHIIAPSSFGSGMWNEFPNNPAVDYGRPVYGVVEVAEAAAIPEPATMILLGTGLAGVAAKVACRRRAREE